MTEVTTPFSLPMTPSKAPKKINPTSLLIFGPSGVGKTTFISQLPNTLFIDTEHSTDFLSGIMVVDVKRNFEKLQDTRAELRRYVRETKKRPYDYIVIDTIDGLLNDVLYPHICKKYGKTSINDFDYGAGYTEAKAVITDYFNFLQKICKCVIFVAHYKKESLNDSEIKFDMESMNFAASIKTMLVHMVDEVGMFISEDGERKIVFKGSDNMEGKSRAHHLSGKTIPADWSQIFITPKKN